MSDILDDPHFTPDTLAERWHVTKETLARWRHYDRGPAYIKLEHKVLYPAVAVHEYEDRNTVNPEKD